MTPYEAKEYGLIDRVLEAQDLATPLPAGVS
jgi:ATP-dependent Clp protease protease subunit